MRPFITLCVLAFAYVLSCAAAAAPPSPIAATPAEENTLAPIRALLDTPEAKIDFAKTKLTIDRMIEPSIDVDAVLKDLDAMAAKVRAMVPPGANRRATLVTLMSYLYQPGPWNNGRPFHYDLDDPFGKDLRNKLLPTYLATRKGNCVSMPVLFVILAQKLGLEVTLSTAPTHMFAKVRDDDGQMFNVENTSGGTKTDASYQQAFGITDQAIQNGIYLQSLTRRENMAVMLDTLMEFYGQQGEHALRIATAQLALTVYPKDVSAMLHQASTYQRLLRQRYGDQNTSVTQLTRDHAENYHQLGQAMEYWGGQAESLGWRENTQAQDAAYQQQMQRVKATQGNGQ